MKITKFLIQYIFYPCLLLIALLFAWNLRQEGEIPFKYMFIVTLVANGFIWLFQYIVPYKNSWHPDKKTLGLDVFYSISAAIVITPLLKLMLFYFYTSLNLEFLQVWPTHWPVVMQLLVAIFFADFFIYWLHRFTHTFKFGWRIHVVHHTPEKLHLWASARTHPINLFLVFSIEVGVLVFLGIGNDVLALWTLFMGINGQFEHCNIDLKLGPFNYIFQTCVTHRVHHSPNWEYSNSNFGNQTVLWDHVFGTFKLPDERIDSVGIKMHQIPENYFAQLKAPFILDRYEIKSKD